MSRMVMTALYRPGSGRVKVRALLKVAVASVADAVVWL